MSVLELRRLTKSFSRTDQPALQSISLTVESGEIFGLLGESGSGKTTALRLIAGFDVPSAGSILLGESVVASGDVFVPPEKRGVRMVFQEGALFPHLTVFQNVRFGLGKGSKRDAREKIFKILEQVDLTGFESRYPHELSGGQRQRAELARALVGDPVLLLLDEPFSGLDRSLKNQVRPQVRHILRQRWTTAILVTHDMQDVFAVCDRMAILRGGQLQQVGSPRQIYCQPANAYVAELFGATNLITGRRASGGVETPLGLLPCSLPDGPAEVLLSVRPECLDLVPEDVDACQGVARRVRFMGGHWEVEVEVASNRFGMTQVVVHLPSGTDVDIGQDVRLRVMPEGVVLLGN